MKNEITRVESHYRRLIQYLVEIDQQFLILSVAKSIFLLFYLYRELLEIGTQSSQSIRSQIEGDHHCSNIAKINDVTVDVLECEDIVIA